jgi:hypothetical protein
MSDADWADRSAEEIDWENRRLCSDESCIGVIGPDGRCKECGRPYDGPEGDFETPEPHAPAQETPSTPSEELAAPPPAAADEGAGEANAEDSDWENRRLCSDESCIGVIGPDGRCKECGKPG